MPLIVSLLLINQYLAFSVIFELVVGNKKFFADYFAKLLEKLCDTASGV